MNSLTRLFTATGLTLALLIAAQAVAQRALDSGQRNAPVRPAGNRNAGVPDTTGRALDANLRVGSGGYNTARRNFADEVAFRNAIVTGNVSGGKSFRGDIGYTAVDDFRGSTGSDQLYAFQRDSAYSGLATQNLRGLTALQLQFIETTSGQRDGLLGDVIVRRSAAGTTSSAASTGGEGSGLSVDPYGNLRGSLRSTSEFVLRNARFPKILGTLGESEEGDELKRYMTSTALQGVKPLSINNAAFIGQERADLLRGRAADEQARTAEPPPNAPKPINPLIESQTPFELYRLDLQKRVGESLSRRVTSKPADATPADQAAPVVEETVQERFDRLIDEMRASFRAKHLTPETDPNAPDKPTLSDPQGMKEEEDGKPAPPALTPEQLIAQARELRTDGKITIEKFLEQRGAEDLYSWHMTKAQEAFAQKKWFDAEERFTAALRTREGDPMAAAGRVNSQVAAGLFVSAAMNLRSLYSAYPELIPARFAADLMPTKERLDGVRLTLRERLKVESGFTRDAVLVLAYIGWQTEQSDDISDAFAALDRALAAETGQPTSLESVIREVWAP